MRISRKLRRILLYTLLLLILGLVSTGIYYFFKLKQFYVINIQVSPSTYVDDFSYIANNELAKKTAYIFPSQHIAFIPKSRIKSQILKDFTEIKELSIDRVALNTISIDGILRTPYFSKDDGMTLDSEGVLYVEPNNTSMLPYLDNGSSTLSKEHLVKLFSFYKKINVRLNPTEKVIVNAENDVIFLLRDNTRVLTRLNDDYEYAWINMLSALDTNPLKNLLRNSGSKLEYIDLRFGNKVFYKFARQNESVATTTNDTGILEEFNQE